MAATLQEHNPDIAAEWHPTKNGEATPSDVTRGSTKKVWWLCPQGHSYEAAIKNRTKSIKPSGCPYCSGTKAAPEKTLAVHSPKVAKEWHPTKNSPLKPTEIGYGSKARSIRKQRGLKFDDVSFMTSRRFYGKGAGAPSRGRRIEYAPRYNPSKRGHFKGVWDAQGNYADLD